MNASHHAYERRIAGGLACLLLAVSAPAAAHAAPAATGTAQAPVTLSMFYPGTSSPDEAAVEDAINVYLRQKLGVALDLHPIEWSQYDMKTKVMIAAGEPMDLFFTAGWQNFKQYADIGVLRDLTPLLGRYAPDMLKTMNPLYLSGTAIDGHNYAVPTQMNNIVWKGLLINKQLAEKYRFDVAGIKKLADLEPMLRVIKDNEKQITPLFGKVADFEALASYQQLAGGPGALMPGGGTKIANEFASPAMSILLGQYYRWTTKGFIVPAKQTYDSFQTQALFTGKAAGQTFAVLTGTASYDTTAQLQTATGQAWLEVRLQAPLVTNENLTTSMLSVSSLSKHAEDAVRVINLLHANKKLLDLLDWGIEGTHYRVDGDSPGMIARIGDAYSTSGPWMFGNPVLAYHTKNDALDPNIWARGKKIFDKAAVSPLVGLYYDAAANAEANMAVSNALSSFNTSMEQAPQDPAKALPKLQAKLKQAGVASVIADKQRQADAYLAKRHTLAAR